jgi:hypothetical protein
VLVHGQPGFAPTPTRFLEHTKVESVAIADLTGDGKNDLAISSRDGSVLRLGGGAVVPLDLPYATRELVAADMNLDGKQDLVAASAEEFGIFNGRVKVLFGWGDGTFQEATVHQVALTGLPGIAVGHYGRYGTDSDGKPDLVTFSNRGVSTSQTKAFVSVFLNRSM